jgi:hypothetical protein
MKERRGAPLGNKNSVGHGAPPRNKNAAGHGAPYGNSNALKTGVHECINPETLPCDEKCLFNNLIKLYQSQELAEVIFKYIRAMCAKEITRINPDGSTTVIPIPYYVMSDYVFNNQLAWAHLILWEQYPWVFMIPKEEV